MPFGKPSAKVGGFSIYSVPVDSEFRQHIRIRRERPAILFKASHMRQSGFEGMIPDGFFIASGEAMARLLSGWHRLSALLTSYDQGWSLAMLASSSPYYGGDMREARLWDT